MIPFSPTDLPPLAPPYPDTGRYRATDYRGVLMGILIVEYIYGHGHFWRWAGSPTHHPVSELAGLRIELTRW